ncbi:hypothetical protein Lxx03760 [Leifsonia xyli subsp. xyli str. CTCB07]|uniref:Uncharacterized protein n=1 Tax=Leifsonia xyli subsp. xyli (strain CTCB07) TaxID=281090 RepID=Q6AGW1_LEIXX|nr:hypothetical protein Lxx03760 [Leifsonia xyli subsp. xyli str. CTCB07]
MDDAPALAEGHRLQRFSQFGNVCVELSFQRVGASAVWPSWPFPAGRSRGYFGGVSVGMDILTITANSIGGVCMVDVAANVYNPNSGAARASGLRLVCDGVQIDDIWQLDIPNPGGASSGVAGVVRAESTPGAGSHTWTFQANASAAASVAIRSAVITVQEV